MANVQVASAGDITDANRVVVRSSGGTVYVFVNNGGNIQAFKGNAQPPTSFAEQEAAGAPDNAANAGIAAAIDADDLVHVVYQFKDVAAHGAAPRVKYAQFRTVDHATTQDDWVLIDENVATLANGGAFSSFAISSIAIDANDIPHVAWTEQITNMGSDLESVSYANRIGGSWNSKVLVAQKSAASGIMGMLDIIVADPASSVNADRPIIICEAVGSETQLDAYHGTALNATAFTQATDITGAISMFGFPSLAIDSNEKLVVAFIETSSSDLMIVEHLNSSAWGTWETPVDVDTSRNYADPSIVIDGTDLYIFVESSTDNDIRLWKDTGGGWSEETTDTHLPQVGTFDSSKGKWASRNNFEGSVQLDYVFEDSGGAVRWQEFILAAVTVVTETHTTDSVLKALDQTVSHDTDSVLRAIDNEITHTTDSFLATAVTVVTLTHTTDSFLLAVRTLTHDTDSVLKQLDNEITHTTDSFLVNIVILTHDTDSVLKALDQTVNHTTDSVLKSLDILVTHTTDSFLSAGGATVVSITHDTDSILKKLDNEISHTTDSLLNVVLTVFHTTDSLVVSSVIVVHTTDSVLKLLDTEITHTTDSVVYLTKTLTHTTDSVLKATDTLLTHTTDSVLKALDRLLTHTTDSALRQIDNILVHTTDSILKAIQTLTHTTDSYLVTLTVITLTHTTDSVLKKLDNIVSHSTDSFLVVDPGIISGDVEADLCVKEQITEDLCADETTTEDLCVKEKSEVDLCA